MGLDTFSESREELAPLGRMPYTFLGEMTGFDEIRSVLRGIAHQLCPRCRIERIFCFSIFRGFPQMRDVCPLCGLKFEREQGYFVGAMIIDYGLGMLISGAIGCVLWYFTRWPLDKTAVVAFLIFLPVIPTLTRFGRVIWIYVDRLLDPEDEEPV